MILVGMHRSGTSMVTRLLARLGLFTGWELDGNGEAVFFVLRNEAILQAQGGRWDDPSPVDRLLSREDLCQRLGRALRGELDSPAVLSYLGPLRYLRYRSPLRLPSPWGWKDPRNSLLLPLWLDLFPDARVVHVVRNGVDVALSLARREQQRLDHVLADSGRLGEVLGVSGRPEGTGALAWAWSQIHLRLHRGGPWRRLGRWRLHPSIEVENGFALWNQYLERVAAAKPRVAQGMFEVRYEDILAQPERQITRLAEYCQLPARPEQIAAVAASVRPEAGNRFLKDPVGAQLYETVRASQWMRHWEYDRC